MHLAGGGQAPFNGLMCALWDLKTFHFENMCQKISLNVQNFIFPMIERALKHPLKGTTLTFPLNPAQSLFHEHGIPLNKIKNGNETG